MLKKVKLLTMVLLAALLIMGCGTKKVVEEVPNTTGTTETETKVEDKLQNGLDTNNNNNNSTTATGQTKVEVAKEAADAITELKEVESANVLVTDKNAYVAVVLKSHTSDALAKDMEDKIADKVRTANTNIENVYVSLNPEFVKEVQTYGTKINAGEPVEGFFDEFTAAMKRVFPNAR